MFFEASFCDLQDRDGRIQLYVRVNEIGAEAYEDFKKYDIGDIAGANGTVFRTHKGEISVKVENPTEYTVDLYIAADLGGAFLWYPAWGKDAYPTEVQTGVWEKRLFSFTVISFLMEGEYTFYAALAEHGTAQALDIRSVTVKIE